MTKKKLGQILWPNMIQKTHREISSIERMDDEGFISQVDNSWDTVARLQGSHWSRDELTSRKVLDGPMIITMFDVLSKYMNKNHVRTMDTRILGWPKYMSYSDGSNINS